MEKISLVTAVSRPQYLRRIHRSITESLSGVPIEVHWILVFDAPGEVSEDVRDLIENSKDVKIKKVIYPGPPMQWGIKQKNAGIDCVEGGWYHLLDDDNIVHPKFFGSIHRAMSANPGKKAFVYGQMRWDFRGVLHAAPERMQAGCVDNTMFVVHTDLIGSDRYDVRHAGIEDFHFFRNIYDKNQSAFVFLDEVLAYYNFLRDSPDRNS